MANKKSQSWILYVGTYPPRECGIATFTRDLATNMNRKFPGIKSKILALNDTTGIYNYPKNVISQINDLEIKEYLDIARKINEMDEIKLVNVQHEFGIFGGDYGNYLIPFLETLEKPVVTTLHTVLPKPDEKRKRIVQSIAERSSCLVVMAEKALDILRDDYGITKDITVIPHGVPTVPFISSKNGKTKTRYKDRLIISSFGMMNPSKGYEHVIDSLPKVIEKFPNLLYLIIGETHPIVRKVEGERYRNLLEKKVMELGLKDNVKFYNKYANLSGIIKYLNATDIYISPSVNPNQIVSGTLSYAMGCGRPVVSTPFLHAKEIVTSERGILAEFNNSESFADAILQLLSDSSLREKMEKNAYSHTRQMTWPNVALSYMKIFEKYAPISRKHEKFPRVKFSHLISLSDDFGIIQFARNTQPDKESGYSLDDNARAMIVCCMHYSIFKSESRLRLIRTYLNFIRHVQQEDGRFYNLVNHGRKIDYERWSDDSHGRALWALGYLISMEEIPSDLKDEAEKIFSRGLEFIENVESPRAIAFSIIGLYHYNRAKPSPERIKKLADHLVRLYKQNSSDEWQWFEEYLTYSNSKLPEALFYAYLATNEGKYLRTAESALDFLISVTFVDGKFAPIGQDGWYSKEGHRAHFDQQPVDTASMVQTLVLANKVTKKKRYRKNALTAFRWFLGENSLNQVIYDESTGGCHDGLGKSSVNLNQGAESTISYLMARLSMEPEAILE